MPIDGAQLFIRYAYPPNELGLCGPEDSVALWQYGAAGVTDRGLVQLARDFAGAWPYLELVASGTGIPDPLDRRVVESYWVGGPLLDRVGVTDIGNSMEDRFKAQLGRHFSDLIDGVEAGGVPHHNFHVFDVSPWTGLMRDSRKSAVALTQLDRCRIRWGRVSSVTGDEAVVMSRHLEWDGHKLALGDQHPDTARVAIDGSGLIDNLRPGDVVSLHYDWVCDRLTPTQLARLRHYTARHLDIANTKLGQPRTPLSVE
jgi:Family of unknown function (DUF6390)